MRAVVQRVSRASVTVDDQTVASIGPGMLILLGVAQGDDAAKARRLATKVAELRIFAGDAGRFDRSCIEAGGEALVVSQFTLLASTRKGRRPSFTDAAPPDEAEPLVDAFAEELRALGIRTETGRFGAHMLVSLDNDGPVTLVVDTEEMDKPRRQR